MNAREEWLVQRRAGLGGSDIGAILGLSPYRTPVDVWMEKTGRGTGQDETLQMRFGSYAEEFVAREYTAKTGNSVQRFTPMLHHPVAPVLGNVDRLVIPSGAKVASHKQEIRTDRGLECKTASAFSVNDDQNWGEEGTDQVPPSYLIQCSTYMALTGCSLWDLAVLFGNQELRIYNLKRDAELEQEIVARSTEWWNRHIVGDVAPEPV
ncbi:MAG: YqaJ viral recombinase family protein, partial [Deltaproteobacteria bacterium]|nr:YqaJ viral recombinase family protein [Deltaproteobacteria bacterium]